MPSLFMIISDGVLDGYVSEENYLCAVQFFLFSNPDGGAPLKYESKCESTLGTFEFEVKFANLALGTCADDELFCATSCCDGSNCNNTAVTCIDSCCEDSAYPPCCGNGCVDGCED